MGKTPGKSCGCYGQFVCPTCVAWGEEPEPCVHGETGICPRCPVMMEDIGSGGRKTEIIFIGDRRLIGPSNNPLSYDPVVNHQGRHGPWGLCRSDIPARWRGMWAFLACSPLLLFAAWVIRVGSNLA